jgi:hypothetical protein
MMIELCDQQKIHQISKLVDGTIQMPPSAVDLVVGFVDPDRSTIWSTNSIGKGTCVSMEMQTGHRAR